MRIAIGEFAHETNTFCPGLTPLEKFQARHWASGDEIFTLHRGVRDSLGGMIAAAEADGITIAPIFATSTEPSATIAQAAYDTIRDHLIDGIKAAGAIDALVLALHAAGVTEGSDDLEGTLLGEIRAAVGPELPIVVTLDLHGHTTRAMVEHATALLYCHEYPHVDTYERGEEAIRLAAAIVRGEKRLVMYLETLPMLIPPSTTRSGPAKKMNELCFDREAQPGMIDVAFVHGFPHTDVSVVSAAILATADGDAALAKEAATDLSRQLWAMREDFRQSLPDAETAVRRALAADARPVVIAEVSDNPGGGAPGDGTHLLRALLAANEPETCFGFVADPVTARQAHQAGTGARMTVRLGGKTDDLHGAPIETEAYVKCLSDGRFHYSTPMGAGRLGNLGPMTRLVIGNVDVLVSSVRTQTLDQEVFLLHGIDVTRYRVVALKSHQHFLAGFQHLAGLIIRADTPGLTTSTLHHLPYQRVPRPIWPLDEMV
ncbi:MAG: M81 family metallopeptidase [Chloroflexia bacterium]|nr:M81 family metallopeptidase [Chloroflexia bacterium]